MGFTTQILSFLAVVLFLLTWIPGMVLAPSWWQKILAIFPLYSWYILVERIMQLTNILGSVGGL